MRHIFLYGVLRADVAQWPFLAGLGPGQPAATRGTLHAVPDPNGWYPALTQGDTTVHGVCHEVGAVDITAIDAFEGSEYSRREIAVSLADAAMITATADAYIWNASLPAGAVLIRDGDFARWLIETGHQPFADI
ncbi:gamma-glutamylcyclotransferase [Altererythrobacter sp. GH1-8]|uniref:gamma-glutamylcyclotransferase family protein n=1 Tax=Altererythrobacter sp. GH1-8 TaxID=3349333 RepID=UPI00374CD10D